MKEKLTAQLAAMKAEVKAQNEREADVQKRLKEVEAARLKALAVEKAAQA